MNVKLKGKIRKFIIPIISLLIIGEVVALGFAAMKDMGKPLSIKDYSKEVVEKCEDAPYRPTCYEKEIPKLMNTISMEDAFQVTRNVQDLDPEYAYCHVLGHELSAIEVRKDPSTWKDVLTRCPSGVCSNGCLHGGLQEKFRGEYLSEKQIDEVKPDLISLCEERKNWKPTGLEQASCYHALGHLTMYITNADIDKAIALCDIAAQKSDGRDFKQLCYDGVFMQIFQPLEPEDFALVKGKQPTAKSVDEFCEKYKDMQRASCQSESWPLFSEKLYSDPNALNVFCTKAEPQYRERCFNAMFYVLTSRFNLDQDKMFEYCSEINEERRPQCFSNAASRMIETDYRNIDKAIGLCSMAKEYDPEEKCFQEMVLYAGYNFHPGSKEFYEICNSLPESWKDECLRS